MDHEPSEENKPGLIAYALSRYGGDMRILKAAIKAAPGGVLKLKWKEGGAKGTVTLRIEDLPED
jgi:hypothetical protein